MITFRLANIRPAKESLPDNTILFPYFTQKIFKVKTVAVKDVLETDIFCILPEFLYKALFSTYWMTQKLPQIHTANHATFPIQIRKITVQIFGIFWVTQCKPNCNYCDIRD